MKVNIGPYKNWIGPYQIADKIIFWQKKDYDVYGDDLDPWAERAHKLGDWLAQDRHGNDSLLMRFCQWLEKKRTRKVKIHIDRWDTWSMDHTLALITLPMLKQLKATKHGAPFVDDEDVPEHLRSTHAKPKENEWDTDSNHFLRWDWVLDEMIQAFECKCNDSWDDQYWTGEADFNWTPTDVNGDATQEKKPKFFELKRGAGHTLDCDWTALKAHQERNRNGFRLFGKYYEGLWD
jgi:hypothetical protein